MKIPDFKDIENFMLSIMTDGAHDREHVYRVLYVALDIAQYETKVDYDVLIASCLLHDIGRKEQFDNPDLCHAAIGSEKAYTYLTQKGWEHDKSERVKQCILTHRYRENNPPKSIEAKILFDADKIDATGTLGIARTLLYNGQVSEPLYLLFDNIVSDGKEDITPSFFHEYKYKLENLYDKFFTLRGIEIAKQRQQSAVNFYDNMIIEVQSSYDVGIDLLTEKLK